MGDKQKLIQLLNSELKTDLNKLESEISDNEFHRIENNGKTPNVYFKKDVDSNAVQLLATTNDEKENVFVLFSLIYSLFDEINKDELKDEIQNDDNYEKLFNINNEVDVSLKRESNTFTISF